MFNKGTFVRTLSLPPCAQEEGFVRFEKILLHLRRGREKIFRTCYNRDSFRRIDIDGKIKSERTGAQPDELSIQKGSINFRCELVSKFKRAVFPPLHHQFSYTIFVQLISFHFHLPILFQLFFIGHVFCTVLILLFGVSKSE